jgi:2-polyprenyl-3-methyl-5-hydroxy-6-metoxy-1,4-benzoquinol methylase
VTATDWLAWHASYDEPESALARRLAMVQQRVREALDDLPAGPVRVLSLCAGQGRDLLEVLASHPRRHDVRALLVELDPRNVAIARQAAREAGLPRVEARVGDAALVAHYRDLAPADLVLVCGVFGNISDEDVRRTVERCAQLCRGGGSVIWTRHRRPPDLVPHICRWFEESGFVPGWLSGADEACGVGVHRYAGRPVPLAADGRMFVFNRQADGAAATD